MRTGGCRRLEISLERPAMAYTIMASFGAAFASAAAPSAVSSQVVVVDLGLLQPIRGDSAEQLAVQLAVQTCAGLYNRDASGHGVYTLQPSEGKFDDPGWLAATNVSASQALTTVRESTLM